LPWPDSPERPLWPALGTYDEPPTGLDIGHAHALLELVDRLRREDGTTVVASLHDLTIAAQYADEPLLHDDGRVAAAGPPAGPRRRACPASGTC
jgi:ABC-type cobalamin/Fe3+-siderophores transport system ATPase subunit